ncbi:hypothetical protein [Streptomyces sp. NPDC002550]
MAARAVLLDFDGPVTDLFGDESTAPVAHEIKDVVRGIWGGLDRDVEECDDSHGILRLLGNMSDRPAAHPATLARRPRPRPSSPGTSTPRSRRPSRPGASYVSWTRWPDSGCDW